MAWVQHMVKSMKRKTGRLAVVLPYGALFRKGTEDSQVIKKDLLEAVIGLGGNIFYGTSLAACIMVFRSQKAKDQKGKLYLLMPVTK
jgi:type I restriction enzyme M protein